MPLKSVLILASSVSPRSCTKALVLLQLTHIVTQTAIMSILAHCHNPGLDKASVKRGTVVRERGHLGFGLGGPGGDACISCLPQLTQHSSTKSNKAALLSAVSVCGLRCVLAWATCVWGMLSHTYKGE